MEYNRLGKAGIKLSELSFGSWITFGENLDSDGVKACMREAFDGGVNFFDTAESYGDGVAEELMGEALKEYRREDLVISTKIFFGGHGPNDRGLSWKHIMEGTKNALSRLQLDYIDLLFCHRPDPETPVEETVMAMDTLIRGGLVFYWGTSEWSAHEIETSHMIARQNHAIPATMEQPEYNMFARERVEKEYLPLYERFGLGTTIWSPLAQGVLTGKYNDGVPKGSRLDRKAWTQRAITEEKIATVKKLQEVAKELDCTMAQLALAWCMKNPHVSTTITGATSVEQVKENLKAVEVKKKLTPDYMQRIEVILQGMESSSLVMKES